MLLIGCITMFVIELDTFQAIIFPQAHNDDKTALKEIRREVVCKRVSPGILNAFQD